MSFPQSEGIYLFIYLFLWCQRNSIYKCFHEPWGNYCSVCSNVGLGQQLSWKNKTNPGPNRRAGLIKHSRVRKALGKLQQTWPLLCTSPGFPVPLPLSSEFIIFLMNYLNMAISHLKLVFKEKATGENNHKLNSFRTAPLLAARARPVPVSEPALSGGCPKSLLLWVPSIQSIQAAQTPVSTGKTCKYQRVPFLGFLPVFF